MMIPGMGDGDSAELYVLRQEYEWLMTEELPRSYAALMKVLEECLAMFPSFETSHTAKAEKFIMSASSHTTNDHVKAVVTVTSDAITQADISVRLGGNDKKGGGSSAAGGGSGGSNTAMQRTNITPDAPWRLQQVQDSSNYLRLALLELKHSQNNPKTSEGSQTELTKVCSLIQNSRQCLLVPRRKTIEELMTSPNMKVISPPLSNDTAISFYIQAHKLVLAVYQIGCVSATTGSVKFESVQAECCLPFLSPVLASLTTALHLTHAINEKIAVFTHYKDFSPDTYSVSTVSN